MSRPIFDNNDGDFIFPISDSMAMDSDGNMMSRISDNMAMDMETGDIHFVSSWSNEEDEDY